MNKTKLTYDEAIQELESIVKNIEEDHIIAMADYTKQAKRATELIKICTTQLRTIDAKLNEIFEQE